MGRGSSERTGGIEEHWGQAQWDLVLADASDTKLRCCIIRDLKKHCWQMAGFYD